VLAISRVLQPITKWQIPIVVDLDAGGSPLEAMKAHILPLASVISVGTEQAEKMLGVKIESIHAMKSAASSLSLGTSCVLIGFKRSLRLVVHDVLENLAASESTDVYWSAGCGPVLAAILRQRCTIDTLQRVEVTVLYCPQEPIKFLLVIHPYHNSSRKLESRCMVSAALTCGLAHKKSSEPVYSYRGGVPANVFQYGAVPLMRLNMSMAF
jgi:hydroxymethylpyrimidine/phosphomethylpyrimidine kinase